MKRRSIFVAALLTLANVPALAAESAKCPDILQHTFPRLQDGAPQSLCQYSGKVVLVVNTASFCGYTRQYEGLEALHARYRERGLAVVGFPSNDFGGQEPGSDREIAEFCRSTYGVKFPMFGKTGVVAEKANPLYDELARRSGKRPGWNFHKYLIDRAGNKVSSFGSAVEPDSGQFLAELERLLASGRVAE